MSTVTTEMMNSAKPAAYTGVMFNTETKKMTYVCWPACRMKGYGVVILVKRQCKTVEQAKEIASKELVKRRAAAVRKAKANP